LVLGAFFIFPAGARGQASAEVPTADISAPSSPPAVAPPETAVPEPVAVALEPVATPTEPAAPTEAASAEAAPAAAPPPALSAAPAPASSPPSPVTSASQARPARPAQQSPEQPEQPEPRDVPEVCVVTAPDGSCLISSTECDILGTPGDDTLNGTFNPEVICGLGGDDLLNGEEGDTLLGGPGDDRLRIRSTPGAEPGGEASCEVNGYNVDQSKLEDCRRVHSFEGAEFRTANPLPATDTGGEPDVVSQTTNAGQVYVAITRYFQAGEEALEAIAVILTARIEYDHGRMSFLVRCSYAGYGRVTLAAFGKGHTRIRLGTASFPCAGDGDDPVVRVKITARGRKLLAGSDQLRINAQVADPDLERQPPDARQTFVFSP
jgi:hypothetical protein